MTILITAASIWTITAIAGMTYFVFFKSHAWETASN